MNDPHDNALDDKAVLEALDEEDLSDAAVEGRDPERSPGDSAVDAPVVPPPDDDVATAALLWQAEQDATVTTSAGDLVDAATGEVLKGAPGWKDGRIQNNDGLDWAGEKLSEVSAVIRENERLRDAAVARLQRRIDLLKARTTDINSPLVMRREFFETAIRAYADAHRADILRGLRKDAKSKRFPSGLRLAWKSGGGYLRLKDGAEERERLLKWVRQNCPEAVVKTEGVDVLAVKKAIGTETVPDGMERVPVGEELKIDVGD